MVNNIELNAVFAALSDPTRRRMIERLAFRPMSVGEMSEGLEISQPGISKHVRILERAGLLKRRIIGRVHRCELRPHAMEAASAWADEQLRFWSGTLDRLDAYLARTATFKKTARFKTKKGR